jgi:hypothetical protein|tara:strand:- start:1060 stop:1251 length:192 start_codon:yes stop_codon:yes gene_type:complete
MKGVKHYKINGLEYKGKTHKHKDDMVMTGVRMSKGSVRLYHYADLSKKAKAKADGDSKKSKKS